MNQPEQSYPFPRDKDELLRDFTVASRLREIQNAVELRQSLAPKWWETLVGVFQFAAALGLLASLVQHPSLANDPLLRLITFWGVLTLLSLVIGFEFMILKLYHLRRANEIALRGLQELDRRLREMERDLEDARRITAVAGAEFEKRAS